ncbi:MAG: glycine/betaine ABC transporter permease [Rothia mucilaginosa]|nr:glycine/betaine ABC transporter permease [Rothia mucilaginosa]
MEPQRKEQETNGMLGSSPEAQPVSSGRLLAHQQELRKPRFSRRALAVAGVGTLGALIVGRQTGILATNEEKQEARLFKRDKVLASLEPNEKFDELVKQGDSTGLLVYTAYERNGRYMPATEEHAAQNVPYPVLQPGMNEYNRGGFYIFQAYFYAALNYFYYTGDTKPLSEVINPEEIISPELLRLYRENRGWLIANQDVYRVQVTIPGIGRRQKNGRNISEYQARRLIRDEAVFYVSETGEKLPIDKFLKTGEEEYAFLCAEHLRGRWVLVEDDKDATPLYPPGFSLEGLEV